MVPSSHLNIRSLNSMSNFPGASIKFQISSISRSCRYPDMYVTSFTSRAGDKLTKMVQKMFLDSVACLQLAAEAGKNGRADIRHQHTRVRKVSCEFVGSRLSKQCHQLLVVQRPDLLQLHELLPTTTSRYKLLCCLHIHTHRLHTFSWVRRLQIEHPST